MVILIQYILTTPFSWKNTSSNQQIQIPTATYHYECDICESANMVHLWNNKCQSDYLLKSWGSSIGTQFFLNYGLVSRLARIFLTHTLSALLKFGKQVTVCK
jgi:hypothetical protein